MSTDQQLLPEDKSKKGMEAYKAEDISSAIAFFSEAVTEYKQRGNTLAAAEAQNNLSICYQRTKDYPQALAVIEGTDELFANGGDKYRQALALGNQAAALEGLGKLEEAIIKYEQCSALLKETGKLEERGIVLTALSTLHMKMGHQLDAIATMQVAIMNEKKPSLKNRILQKLLKIPFGS